MRKDQLGRGFVGVLTATFLLRQLPCSMSVSIAIVLHNASAGRNRTSDFELQTGDATVRPVLLPLEGLPRRFC
jgi:hypothetical protein